MLYIMTKRGWRLLHKQHYKIAERWRELGLDVEERVGKFSASDFWVNPRGYDYWDVMTRLFYSARHRAKKSSIEFSISKSDYEIPDVCPLRGVPFEVGRGQHTDNSPTLDRKDPRLGYVKGNVWVISHKANRLKGHLTPDELKTFCENVLTLDWVTSTSDDEDEFWRRQAEERRKLNEKEKPRWWSLYGQRSPLE